MENVFRTGEEPLSLSGAEHDSVEGNSGEQEVSEEVKRKDSKRVFRHAIADLDLGVDM